MRIGVAAETDPAETRVAASPETVKKFVDLGAEVAVEHGAGLKAGMIDADFRSAGARLASAEEALGADLVLKVRRPSAGDLARVKNGGLIVAVIDPHRHQTAIDAIAKTVVASVAIELLPRTT